MGIGIDNIIAAIVLSLIMLRRIEVRAAQAASNTHVAPDIFESWRKKLLSAYELGAAACALKVALTLGWQWAVWQFSISQPWYSAVPASVFVVWVITMVSVWRTVSEARTRQERLGIVLTRHPGVAP